MESLENKHGGFQAWKKLEIREIIDCHRKSLEIAEILECCDKSMDIYFRYGLQFDFYKEISWKIVMENNFPICVGILHFPHLSSLIVVKITASHRAILFASVSL